MWLPKYFKFMTTLTFIQMQMRLFSNYILKIDSMKVLTIRSIYVHLDF
jgi:hypothetical protein